VISSRSTLIAYTDIERTTVMRISLMVIATAALLTSPALVTSQALAESKNQATLSRAPIASNSTFVNHPRHVLGVDRDLTVRLGLKPDREPGY
jgi:hypothetical protein